MSSFVSADMHQGDEQFSIKSRGGKQCAFMALASLLTARNRSPCLSGLQEHWTMSYYKEHFRQIVKFTQRKTFSSHADCCMDRSRQHGTGGRLSTFLAVVTSTYIVFHNFHALCKSVIQLYCFKVHQLLQYMLIVPVQNVTTSLWYKRCLYLSEKFHTHTVALRRWDSVRSTGPSVQGTTRPGGFSFPFSSWRWFHLLHWDCACKLWTSSISSWSGRAIRELEW